MYFCRKSIFMTQLELFEKYKKKFPLTYTERVGFRDSINQILSDYRYDIKELDKGLHDGFENDIDIYILMALRTFLIYLTKDFIH